MIHMRKKQNFTWDTLQLGTCYYPEHWDRSLWEEDLKRMLENGIQTVRIAEFAWSKVEPREGEFTYAFFDDFLDVAEKAGMKVIFGTPSATPPAWLTEKYPEVLNVRKDGVKYRHGMRRHYNYNSPKYQELTARITEKIAAHYAKHPAIIGWQIDNELNCETSEFYSEADTLAFREFLKKKYQTLDALNQAWGTVFWNQTYTEWEEIYVPRPTIHESDNPHLKLDYIRFVSDSAIRWCRMQYDILKKYIKPGDFITTNGMFEDLDNHAMQDSALDVYTFDSYPNFAYCLDRDPLHSKGLNDRAWSGKLTEVRSICPHFGIMEQQSGANGWNTRMEAPSPKPGQMKLWAMQSITHGADYVSFFRWRTSRMGTEIYWHGILDYDNRDNRKLKEVHSIWERVKAIAETTGAEYKAAVGMLRDYDNIWDAEVDRWHQRLAWSSEDEIFYEAQVTHTPLDYVWLLDSTDVEELAKYKVLFYPHPIILTQQRAALLKAYVEQGGTLIIGARAGQKELTGQCSAKPMPGALAEITGTDVTDFTLIGPADEKQMMSWNGCSLETGLFSDILHVSDENAKVLAAYEKDYYAGSAALVENACGKGKILHFGGSFTRENVKAFLEYAGVLAPYADLISLPECCELAVKEKDGQKYLFVLNYSVSAQTINLKCKATDMDDSSEACGPVELPKYGTKVYKLCL